MKPPWNNYVLHPVLLSDHLEPRKKPEWLQTVSWSHCAMLASLNDSVLTWFSEVWGPTQSKAVGFICQFLTTVSGTWAPPICLDFSVQTDIRVDLWATKQTQPHSFISTFIANTKWHLVWQPTEKSVAVPAVACWLSKEHRLLADLNTQPTPSPPLGNQHGALHLHHLGESGSQLCCYGNRQSLNLPSAQSMVVSLVSPPYSVA